MSVKIRLARFGRNKVPFYHLVATDSRNRRDSKFLEKLGTFNPLLNDDAKEKLKINEERIKYWLGVGAIPSDRVAILLIKSGIKEAEKYAPVFVPKPKQEKKKNAKEAKDGAKEESGEAKTETKEEVKEDIKEEAKEEIKEEVKEEKTEEPPVASASNEETSNEPSETTNNE